MYRGLICLSIEVTQCLKFCADTLFDHGLNSKSHSGENLSILENSAITWPYTDHPTFRPSAPQVYQCLISHSLASLGACNLILYIHVLINCCQNSVSADQYRLTLSRAQVSTHWVLVFFLRYPLTSCYFSIIAGSSSNFLKCIWNKSSSWAALLKCWCRTDLGRENSTGFYIYMQGKQSLLTFLTVTRWSRSTSNFYVLIGQNLTGEFMRKIYAASGNCLLVAGAYRVLCHLVMF